MRVKLILKTGHSSTLVLPDETVFNTTIVKHDDRLFSYAGMKSGVLTFREVGQPFLITEDITFVEDKQENAK